MQGKIVTRTTIYKARDRSSALVISKLLKMEPNIQIAADDHNAIIRNIIASINDTAELIRRELCAFGIIMATRAEKVIQNLAYYR